MTVLRTIRLLITVQLLRNTRCQDGFGDRDIVRFQHMSSDDGQIETITGFSIIQRDPTNQAVQSGQQYQQYADSASKNEDYGRTGRRKVYRIRNPFQNQDDNERPENTELEDSSTGASNQYPSMQYSLPPEEFLQQLRAENQYYQQQQVSTPAPSLAFTVTPQPQYQYSTTSQPNYDSNNQNQIQLQAKITPSQSYTSTYQYSTPSTFLDNIQSTSSPVSYLSTPMNTGQYVGTQSSTYLSSVSPIYLSSPSNLQQYISSPLSVIHTPDYNGNRVTTTIGSNSLSYDNDPSKKMQQEHYDYSANNYRYPVNIQQQYQNDYTSTTTTTSSPYPMRDPSWQNAVNNGGNALSKSLQDVSFTQYQNYPYNNNQQEVRTDTSSDNSNSDTHRIGNMASANNIYMNYAQPDNQMMNNLKIRTRDLDNETGQKEFYSNGDYGWKMNGKKPYNNNEVYSFEYPKYQTPNLSSDSVAVSQMSFHMDTGKTYNNEQAKPITESIESQEFAKAAAKAHDRFKQQQQYYNNNYGYNNEGNPFFSINDKQKNRYTDNSNVNTNQYAYSNTQHDLITASPFLISNSRDIGDTKSKQPFDHDKALKTIVPIGVSNVVSNSGSPLKEATSLDYNNRFSTPNYGKDQLEQSVRQYIRPVSDSYYKDKSSAYHFNIKTKTDEYVTPDSLKQIEAAIYAKQQQNQDQSYNQGSYTSSQNYGYNPHAFNNQDSMQSSSVNQLGSQRNHNTLSQDIASLLKLNDVPYRLTQGLSNDALKLHNINFDQNANVIPTPIPPRINQNVDSHQLDVATSLINKLLLNKQAPMAINRPIESDSQLPTINGFKVANPFNLDLKLVADMLKGKPTADDTYMMSMRDTNTKPLKFDLSQLQHLLNNENTANLSPISDGLSALSNPYLDIYNNGRFPYQGVKYSRSQEEEETLPIPDSTNTHPIGAVIEEDDPASEREANTASDLTGLADDVIPVNFDETRSKHYMSGHRNTGDKYRSLNSLSGRHSYHRKYPKNNVEEPYPLLKPPPRQSPVARSNHMKMEKNRRRRVIKPKMLRVLKSEPMFESGVDPESLETSVPILLRPPPVAESKSDTDVDDNST